MKTICKACFLAVGILSLGHSVTAQETEINDMTTPLHLLQPEYKVPYGNLTVEQVKKDIDRVFAYIEQHTPVRVLDTDGKEVTDYRHIPHGSTLDRGTFRIGSYEWGVTYQALLDASDSWPKSLRDSASFTNSTKIPTHRWNKSCTRKHWTMPEPCVAP